MLPTEIEKFVLRSLDHIGWYPELWFPAVHREAIDFPGEPTDDEIHTALFRLIEDGAIEIGRREGDAFVRISVPISEVPERLRERDSEHDLKIDENTRQQLQAALIRSVVPHRGYFELFAHGESFDVDAFLTSTRLEFDRVWHRGGSHGVARHLGNGATIGLEKQQQIAVEFLKANRDPLRELAKFPGVETFILGLQHNIAVNRGLLSFCMSPSEPLMCHALDVGVTPTFYVVLVHDGDSPMSTFSRKLFLEGW